MERGVEVWGGDGGGEVVVGVVFWRRGGWGWAEEEEVLWVE